MGEDTGISGVSLLVVEDSRTQAEILRHLLNTAGYLVRTASNGIKALEEVKRDRPDLVLTDIVMPEMNGYDLCRTIKSNPAYDTPVILITQLFDPGDVIHGLACGADDFIIKPYREEYLLGKIAAILSHWGEKERSDTEAVSIFYAGEDHDILSSKQQILNILLSTYEVALQKNNDLQEARDHLTAINDELCDANERQVKINNNLLSEIAERKRIEQALFQANKKLSLLSSITRHDMKNTLLVIRSYMEIALMETSDDMFITYLKRESELLSRLSAQIEFTRLYDQLGAAGTVWISPYDLIASISPSFAGVSTIMSDEVKPYEIFVDPLIEKVFYNLFDNALRHGDHVKTIRVTTSLWEKDLYLLFADDGAGVAQEEKEKIFGRGYGKNTGLGLFLVREILSITGITITEEGKEGEGACFVLGVPEGHYRRNTEARNLPVP